MNHDQRWKGGRERGQGGLLCCLLMSLLWLTSCGTPAPPVPSMPPRSPEVIELELSDEEGVEWSLERARGEPLLLYFFTTWCRPCIALAQQLRRYERDIEDPLPRWGVCLDKRAARRLSQFRQVTGLQHPLLLPRGALKQRETPLGHLSAVPEAWLIDEEGRVIERFYGSLPIEYLTRWYRKRRAARVLQPTSTPAGREGTEVAERTAVEEGGGSAQYEGQRTEDTQTEDTQTEDTQTEDTQTEDTQTEDTRAGSDERRDSPQLRELDGVDTPPRRGALEENPPEDSDSPRERTEQDGG